MSDVTARNLPVTPGVIVRRDWGALQMVRDGLRWDRVQEMRPMWPGQVAASVPGFPVTETEGSTTAGAHRPGEDT